MTLSASSLAVFPLPLILLPGGVTRLRIFEQRYIRMVRDASEGNGFALSILTPSADTQSSTIAAHVQIVDFATLPDGLLSIDVHCTNLVSLSEMDIEEDGLRRATANPVEHWPDQSHNQLTRQLATQLRALIENEEALRELYPHPNYESPVWVCRRWIELLPVGASCKAQFFAPDSYPDCLKMLEQTLSAEYS